MTAQTKTALRAEIGTNYLDNTTGAITPATVRTTSTDGVDSWQQAPQVKAQIGSTYTVIVDDYGQLITFSNAATVNVSIPAATAVSFFPFNVMLKNNGAGNVVITPTLPSTIDGNTTLTLNTGQSAYLVSDGTNWRSAILSSAAAGSIFTPTVPGLAPASGGGTANFLRADATWVTPAGAGNVVGSGTSVVGHLASWNNASATALIDLADWSISSHALVPVNDNASDLGTAALRLRTIYGITHNIMGATSGQIGFNAPATVTSYALTWPAAAPSSLSNMQVSSGGAVSFAPVATSVPAVSSAGRLVFTGATTLRFAPFNGNSIKINGSLFVIPNAGIAGLANTGVFVNGTGGQNLAVSTLYYVYAFSNSGVVTADFSTTGHSTSAIAGNEGTEIKTGDDTRSLIGMIMTNASAQFVDNVTSRLVATWFNRRPRSIYQDTAGSFNTSSAPFTPATGIALSFLTWGDAIISQYGTGYSSNSTVSVNRAAIDLDGVQVGLLTSTLATNVGDRCGIGCGFVSTPTEGFHTGGIDVNTTGGVANFALAYSGETFI